MIHSFSLVRSVILLRIPISVLPFSILDWLAFSFQLLFRFFDINHLKWSMNYSQIDKIIWPLAARNVPHLRFIKLRVVEVVNTSLLLLRGANTSDLMELVLQIQNICTNINTIEFASLFMWNIFKSVLPIWDHLLLGTG